MRPARNDYNATVCRWYVVDMRRRGRWTELKPAPCCRRLTIALFGSCQISSRHRAPISCNSMTSSSLFSSGRGRMCIQPKDSVDSTTLIADGRVIRTAECRGTVATSRVEEWYRNWDDAARLLGNRRTTGRRRWSLVAAFGGRGGGHRRGRRATMSDYEAIAGGVMAINMLDDA